jgi:hypothetical protein
MNENDDQEANHASRVVRRTWRRTHHHLRLHNFFLITCTRFASAYLVRLVFRFLLDIYLAILARQNSPLSLPMPQLFVWLLA